MKVVISRDVIFDERPNPPAPPCPLPDLSKLLLEGDIPPDGLPGISQVGDGWDDIPVDASPPRVRPTIATSHPRDVDSVVSPALPLVDKDDLEIDNPQPPPGPGPIPPHVPPPVAIAPVAAAPRRRRTEAERLGTPPMVDGPRDRRQTVRYVPGESVLAPAPVAGDDHGQEADDSDEQEVAEIAMVLAAVVHATAGVDPRTLREAMAGPDASSWQVAVDAELASLTGMGTFEFIDKLPTGRRAISSKLVFKIKRLPDGSIERHKVRLVARGFSQMPGLDFDEVFAPVVKLTSLRVLCALAVQLQLYFHHLDVDTAFLNGALEDELYMRLPNGIGALSGKLVKLLRSIYGLKQASRIWNELLDAELRKLGFRRIHADYCIYVLHKDGHICFIAVYVDDMGILCDDLKFMEKVKKLIAHRFRIRDLGQVAQFLGIAIDYDRDARTLRMSQTRYVEESLVRFHCNDGVSYRTPLSSGSKLSKDDCPITDAEKEDMADAVRLYQSLVGTLMYAMLATRPDIAWAVGQLSKFSSNPARVHLDQAFHCLRYLHGTKDYGLQFNGNSEESMSSLILGYTDSDWAGDFDTRRSTSGYVFLMCGAAVSWSSKLQASPALSSTEAEYMACTRAAQEAIWLRQLLDQLGFSQTRPTRLLGDNLSSHALAKNPSDHPRTKHIQLRYHFIRFAIDKGHVELEYIPTAQMAADGLTKGLSGDKHMAFVGMLGMGPRSSGSDRA